MLIAPPSPLVGMTSDENYWQYYIALKKGVSTLEFPMLVLYSNLLSEYGLIAKRLKHLRNKRQ